MLYPLRRLASFVDAITLDRLIHTNIGRHFGATIAITRRRFFPLH